jgi:hypothetical protein
MDPRDPKGQVKVPLLTAFPLDPFTDLVGHLVRWGRACGAYPPIGTPVPHASAEGWFLFPANVANPSGRPLRKEEAVEILRSGLAAIGMSEEETLRFSLHSLRAGGATDLHNSGLSDTDIQKQGGWSSDAFRIYIRPEDATLSSLGALRPNALRLPTRPRSSGMGAGAGVSGSGSVGTAEAAVGRRALPFPFPRTFARPSSARPPAAASARVPSASLSSVSPSAPFSSSASSAPPRPASSINPSPAPSLPNPAPRPPRPRTTSYTSVPAAGLPEEERRRFAFSVGQHVTRDGAGAASILELRTRIDDGARLYVLRYAGFGAERDDEVEEWRIRLIDLNAPRASRSAAQRG